MKFKPRTNSPSYKFFLLALIGAALLFLTHRLREALKPENIKGFDATELAPITELLPDAEIAGKPIVSATFSNDSRRLFLEIEEEDKSEIFLWEEHAGLRKLPFSMVCLESKLVVNMDGTRAIFVGAEKVKTHCSDQTGKADLRLYYWQEGSSISELAPTILSPDKWRIEASPTLNRLLLYPSEKTAQDQLSKPILFNIISDKETNKLLAVPEDTFFQKNNTIAAAVLQSSATLLTLADLRTATLVKNKKKPRTYLQDFDLDSISDLLVYADSQDHPTWFAYSLSGVDSAAPTASARYGRIYSYQVGLASSIPVEGDYNGDGLLDLATYTPGDLTDWQQYRGIWRIYPSTNQSGHIEPSGELIERLFGGPDEVPMPGDYDGDGKTDIATYSPASSIWKILYAHDNWDIAKGQAKVPSAGLEIPWGTPGDLPISGDFDGDGRADLVTYQSPETAQAIGTWKVYYLPSRSGKQRPPRELKFGEAGSIPVSGDYNCDGADELASYSPSSEQWTVLISGNSLKSHWGIAAGTPLSGDFDGDGCADFAFFIPVTASSQSYVHWAILPSSLKGKGLKNLDPAQGILTRIPWRPMKGLPSQLIREQFAKKVSEKAKPVPILKQ